MKLFRFFSFVFIFLAASLLYLHNTSSAHAYFLQDLVEGIKQTFAPTPTVPEVFSIDSQITLAKDGDTDKNGQIDAGDTVTFTYTIKNTTKKAYAFGTLKTGIDRKQINFIHNILGATGIEDTASTINIPNVRVESDQIPTVISFDARVNYYQDKDVSITTEPQFLTQTNEPVLKSVKKEIKAKRIKKEKIPGMINTIKQN